MKKLRVGIIFGGYSSERAVSLVTGRSIYEKMPREKYIPSLIEQTKQKTFNLYKNNTKIPFNFEKDGKKLFDIFFIALHGEGGEDGKLQGMLELFGLRYTGPGVAASACAMDKVITGKLYSSVNLPTPEFIAFDSTDWTKNKATILRAAKQWGSKVVVKPTNQGSAVGVNVVTDLRKLSSIVDTTIKQFPSLMIQQFIDGAEATCGVLEKNGIAMALPPTHILPQENVFYDYASKYKPGGSRHVCPADFSAETNAKLESLAVQAHKILGCRGMSRTDFLITKQGKIFILETNTIPGMTPTSLFPEAAQKKGIDFGEMLNLIIQASYFKK